MFIRASWRPRDFLPIVPVAIAAAMLALLAGQVAKVHIDRIWLVRFNDQVLSQAEDVAAASANALHRLQESTSAPCSAGDIETLRFLTFNARYLRDMGRLIDGKFACSAAWGQLDVPQPMPPPSVDRPPLRLWTGIANPADPRLITDFAAEGNAFVVTSPTAFASLSHMESALSALVFQSGSLHRYQVFGAADGLDPNAAEAVWDIGATRIARHCSRKFDFCAVSRLRQSSLFAQSPSAGVALGLLGGALGTGIGLLLMVYRRHRRSLPMQLQRAITSNGLTMHYQPLRALDDRRLVGAEALVRWCNADGEWVPPDMFVPLAARMRLDNQLTRQVVCKSLQQMRERLCDAGTFYLSINVWASDLTDPGFHAFLNDQCALHGIDPHRVVLELNERSSADLSRLALHMQSLRSMGYRLYIDDFGTGHSNLTYLTSLPIDSIKIDRSLTRYAGESSLAVSIMEPILRMTEQLDISVVVEGIATEEQARFVLHVSPRAIGQGWLLDKPVAMADFPAN